jgi:hypothetical protein
MFLVSVLFLCIGLCHNYLAADGPDGPYKLSPEQQQAMRDTSTLCKAGFFGGPKATQIVVYCRSNGGDKEYCRQLLSTVYKSLETEGAQKQIKDLYKKSFAEEFVPLA